ncbi:hypothetical protein C4D60_Mb11t00610 [Musa balbisiana]|uniref:Uncharacterized protein n=1 Tax=Musa balbisiana TaxID=52838 RepID=A0A4S8J0Q8_MUSBA|nr:hypothetical protein C4D60_Mb11t00610 [Musa balbisiana]
METGEGPYRCVPTIVVDNSPIRVPVLHFSHRSFLDSGCIIFSIAKHGKEECVALGGGADWASKTGVAHDVDDNTRKIEEVRALRRED